MWVEHFFTTTLFATRSLLSVPRLVRMVVLTGFCQKSFLVGMLVLYLLSAGKGFGTLFAMGSHMGGTKKGEAPSWHTAIKSIEDLPQNLWSLGMMFYHTEVCLPIWVFFAALLLLGDFFRKQDTLNKGNLGSFRTKPCGSTGTQIAKILWPLIKRGKR